MKHYRLLSIIVILTILTPLLSFSQIKKDYSILTINDSLKTYANAIIKYEKKHIIIDDYNKMTVKTERVVTILNKQGNKYQNLYEHYDNNTKIKSIEAVIYNSLGVGVKKIKSRDFSDESAVPGGTLYSDNRVKYYDYKPLKYPYTISYTSEVSYKSTAFIPQWMPLRGFYIATVYSEFLIENNSAIVLRTKEENFENYNIERINDQHFIAKNLNAIKYEDYNRGFTNIAPRFKSALTTFNMEGVKGENTNWKDFGKWMHSKLLINTDDVPQIAIDEVKKLTANVSDPIEKAKIVYNYMQNKTRYISVQVGIGGWKPMQASSVDQLGYSDCKGLSNYTKALLDAVGVPSYYTVVWSGKNIKNIDKSFSMTEGNHAILCVPKNEDYVFLECTSQTNPFGLTAGFTDDRDVLLITPEGGKIVHTNIYNAEDSQQITNADVTIDTQGKINAQVAIKTTGYQYTLHEHISSQPQREQDLYYKEYWSNINNLKIESFTHHNDKDAIVFKENVTLSADNYASVSGKRLILKPNFFNRLTKSPTRYTNRQLDFKIQRAYKDIDSYTITLPNNVSVEALPEPTIIETKFGSYKTSIKAVTNTTLKYTREYTMRKGEYSKEDYKAFRAFRKKIIKSDKTKMVLLIN